MKLSILAGSTSQTVNVFIQDSTSTTGQGLAGLVFNSSGLKAYYGLPKAASVAVTLATLAAVTSAFSSGGFIEIDATNMKGWYRFDIPDAALASGRFVSVHFYGATNMAPCPLEIELTATNNQSAATFMTGVNGVAPPTNWNLISIDSNGRLDIIKIAGTTQTARDIGASVLLSSGTGTGQLDFTSGVVKGNATQFAGQTITAAAGVTMPATVASTTNITAGTITTVSGNVSGNVVGSVGSVVGAAGSVTGAVGSVTGNVGGNVTGSVGSVVADVGITQGAADKVFGASGAAMAELGAVPSATPSPRNALMLMFMALRNKLTVSATAKTLTNDAGSAIASKVLSDSGTVYTEDEMS